MLTRRVRRLTIIIPVFALFLVVLTMPVLGKPRPTQPTDPNAASPAGVVYSIPLDTARQDGSPHQVAGGPTGSGGGPSGGGGGGGTLGGGGGTGGGTGGSGGGAGGGGRAAASASGSASRAAGGVLLVPGGQPGSLVHSANGYGSSSAVPGVNAPLPAGLRAVQGSSSSAPVFAVLLAAVMLVFGAYAGARSWRTRARSSQA